MTSLSLRVREGGEDMTCEPGGLRTLDRIVSWEVRDSPALGSADWLTFTRSSEKARRRWVREEEYSAALSSPPKIISEKQLHFGVLIAVVSRASAASRFTKTHFLGGIHPWIFIGHASKRAEDNFGVSVMCGVIAFHAFEGATSRMKFSNDY